jgi:hypothetical protein
MVQADHITVYSNSTSIKHFKAVCPVTKVMVSNVYSNANSLTAAKFLQKMIDDFPFEITSIQVDGGSEFMKDFELLCQEKIYLYSFYHQNLLNITVLLKDVTAQPGMNSIRPHQSLGNLTPTEYFKKHYQEVRGVA